MWKEQYSRQISLDEFGIEGQKKLGLAKVVIVGVGGLGCPVSLYLTGMGIGELTLIDDDIISISNIHRQVLFSYSDIGSYKAEVAARKLKELNPQIKIKHYVIRLNPDNILDMIKDADLVIDGCDNFYTKYLVNDACVILGKPWVYGSVYKFQGQVSLFNFKNGATYRCLYSSPSNLDSCSVSGVLGVLPGIIGTIMANEAVKAITGVGKSLSGRLLLFNSLSLRISIHNVKLIPASKNITNLSSFSPTLRMISLAELTKEDYLIDVRNHAEHIAFNIGGININLDNVSENIKFIADKVKPMQRIVFYCKSGARSKLAVKIAVEAGLKNVYSLDDNLPVS